MKHEYHCSEQEQEKIAGSLAEQLQAGDRVLLEGPLGAGKTSFARVLLLHLGVLQPPEGSPTFAIAHEYQTPQTEIIHIDFYRLKFEEEIEESGIPSYFWERSAIVITEWLSNWPAFEALVLQSGRIWKITLKFDPEDSQRRILEIQTSEASSKLP